MTTDEIIKKLGIEPVFAFIDEWDGGRNYYTRSDIDRIVAELSAGYEAKIKRWVDE